MGFKHYIYSQFGNPRGIVGKLAGHIMYNRTSNRERNIWALSLLRVRREDTFLEIGFGPGFALEYVATELNPTAIYGTDHSKLMVEITRKRLATIKSHPIRLYCDSAESLALLPPNMSRILCTNCHQFWTDKGKVYSRLRNILAPDGRLAICYQPRNFDSKEEDSKLAIQELIFDLEENGFETLSTDINNEIDQLPAICVIAKLR